jgi:hypothetical protein
MEGLRGRIALQIRNQDDVPIFSSASTDSKSILNGRLEVGDHVDVCKVPGNLLTPGRYYLTVSQPTGTGDAILENICSFRIDSGDSLVVKDGRQGVIAPRLDWSSRKMNGVAS